MKRERIIYSIIIIIVICVSKSYGQQTDSTRRKSIAYLGQYLKTDTGTARRVSDAQESYKKGARQVMDNRALTEQQKRTAIDGLIDEKNRKLEQLLSPQQRDMIIPTTERRAWRTDSTTRKTN